MASTPNPEPETIIIPQNKLKYFWWLVTFLAFFAIAVWMTVDSEASDDSFHFAVGIACIIIFLFVAIVFFIKLFDTKPGLVVDRRGITTLLGFIAWDDIIKIIKITAQTPTVNNYKQKLLLIYLKDPEEYMQKQHNNRMQKLLARNYIAYGTPIAIITNFIKYNYNELYMLLANHWDSNR